MRVEGEGKVDVEMRDAKAREGGLCLGASYVSMVMQWRSSTVATTRNDSAAQPVGSGRPSRVERWGWGVSGT
jgi:hypothetical protein